MIIGYTEFAPMNYKDDNGELIGFETEFAKAVCAELGVEPVFQLIDWAAKETELKSKTSGFFVVSSSVYCTASS